MKAFAGPAMLLVLVGGYLVHRSLSKEDAPSRDFVELELAAEDEDHSGTCYSLSTVLIANGVFGNALRTWKTPDERNEDKWTLVLEAVQQGPNGPVREYRNFTFEKFGEQVRLVDVEASEDYPTDIEENIDKLLEAPHARKSTPVDRCRKDGGTGYQFPKKK
jgi:hypothetical protein